MKDDDLHSEQAKGATSATITALPYSDPIDKSYKDQDQHNDSLVVLDINIGQPQ